MNYKEYIEKCKNCGHRIMKLVVVDNKYYHVSNGQASTICFERDCKCKSPEPATQESKTKGEKVKLWTF